MHNAAERWGFYWFTTPIAVRSVLGRLRNGGGGWAGSRMVAVLRWRGSRLFEAVSIFGP